MHSRREIEGLSEQADPDSHQQREGCFLSILQVVRFPRSGCVLVENRKLNVSASPISNEPSTYKSRIPAGTWRTTREGSARSLPGGHLAGWLAVPRWKRGAGPRSRPPRLLPPKPPLAPPTSPPTPTHPPHLSLPSSGPSSAASGWGGGTKGEQPSGSATQPGWLGGSLSRRSCSRHRDPPRWQPKAGPGPRQRPASPFFSPLPVREEPPLSTSE